MTSQAELAAGAAAVGAEGGDLGALAGATSPFVLNLCSSSTPMALAQTDLPELKRFTFFVSRRFEEGRERFRLHMGYFATLAEAEEWLAVVRDIYPGAWAGEAPGRRLRERAAAAAAAQAQHAAGPQPRMAGAPAMGAAPPPIPLHVPVVHAAAPAAERAPVPARPAAPVRPPEPARGPAPLLTPAAPGAAVTRPAATRPAPVRPPQAAKPQTRTAPAPGVAERRAVAPPVAARPAPRAAVAAKSPPPPARPPAPAAVAARSPARPAARPAFEDSNVREVLAALGDASATGETRLMHAPPPPRPTPAASDDGMSDTQVLRMLETRRPEGAEPVESVAGNNIPMLKPDDTGTRAALKQAVVSNAAVSFAVQLQWSVQPVELQKVPPLAIFSAYTLYTVEGSREGRKWYGLRLGFFSDAISAKQVAYYVRSEFASVAVVPVSPQERARATDDDRRATFAAGPAPRRSEEDEFKLFDDAAEVKIPTPGPAAKSAVKPVAPRTAAPAVREARNAGKVGARERRGAQTLEETLEILGASQLAIDEGSGVTLNDSGVRHLRVEVQQQRNSPFARLLERLSDRVKKQ
jgi:hypothetical protein